MHTIARYYNTSERMTTLFQKVTNQMIRNCREHILAGGKLWDQDKPVRGQHRLPCNEVGQLRFWLRITAVARCSPYYGSGSIALCARAQPHGWQYKPAMWS